MVFPSSLDWKAQVISGLALVLLAFVAWRLGSYAWDASGARRAWLAAGSVLIVALAVSLFAASPRGVLVRDGEVVLVRRLGGNAHPLARLSKAQRIDGLPGALRVFGVGGLFGWFGRFSSQELGRFHLHATRLDRLVLLELGEKRLVVSVDDPDGLIRALQM